MVSLGRLISSLYNPHPTKRIGRLKLIVNKVFFHIGRLSFLRGKPYHDLIETLIRKPFNLTSYAFYNKELNAVMFFYDADSYLILFGVHEPFFSEYFKPTLGDTVIDIGAHIGKHTIFSSRCVGKRGRVIAIEAHPRNYMHLIKNLKINSIRNVHPINVAVDEANRQVDLYEAAESGWHSVNPVLLHDKKIKRKIRVPAKTLDTIVEEFGLSRIDWIKIDVEGGENRVLLGGIRSLRIFKPKTLIEIHNADIGTKVIKTLKKVDYNIRIIHGEVRNGWYYLIAEKS